jgi:membrane fusion protein, multidrug efflux system
MLKQLTPPPRRSRLRRFFRATAFTILLVAAGFGGWRWYETNAHRAAGKPATAPTAAPVDTATAQRTDFPVYLSGLGVAQAWNTVVIRTRVDGQIDKVAFKEGETVHQGDLLLQIDSRPFQAALDQALAKKTLDEALLANSKRDLVRYTTVGTLAVTQQQIDTQRALVQQQQAQIKSDQGAIDNAQVQLGYTTINAPIAGRIGFRLVDQGNIVHAGDPTGVAAIAQIEPIAVVFTAPEEQLPRINDALNSGPLPVIAYTSDGKTELDKGTLALVDNQVDATTGTIRLKAEFPNTKHKLWPALTVATRLLIETLHDVVVIPDVAVQRGPDGLYAYVVGEDGKAQMRKLEVGVIQDGRAVIAQGISVGDRVVTSGYYRLQPGSPIELRHGDDPTNGERHSAAAVGVQTR